MVFVAPFNEPDDYRPERLAGVGDFTIAAWVFRGGWTEVPGSDAVNELRLPVGTNDTLYVRLVYQ